MRISPLAVSIAISTAAFAATADAQSRRGPEGPQVGYVTAESRYGPQTITAPVRLSVLGRREVRLPGGTWIECRRSCAETLRQETIDFWIIRQNGTNTDGPGYIRFRWDW
jgi:hypothetical protein